MKVEQIKFLLNDNKTTVTQVLKFIQASIDEFQEKIINSHAESIKQQLTEEGVKHFDLEGQSEILFAIVQKEVVEFLEKQHVEITDLVLDLLNEKQVNKQSAFNFIAILTTVRDMFKEQILNEK